MSLFITQGKAECCDGHGTCRKAGTAVDIPISCFWQGFSCVADYAKAAAACATHWECDPQSWQCPDGTYATVSPVELYCKPWCVKKPPTNKKLLANKKEQKK